MTRASAAREALEGAESSRAVRRLRLGGSKWGASSPAPCGGGGWWQASPAAPRPSPLCFGALLRCAFGAHRLLRKRQWRHRKNRSRFRSSDTRCALRRAASRTPKEPPCCSAASAAALRGAERSGGLGRPCSCTWDGEEAKETRGKRAHRHVSRFFHSAVLKRRERIRFSPFFLF